MSSRFVEIGKKIIGVGKNFKDPNVKSGNVPTRPLIFMKPSSSYITEGKPIKIPTGCQNLEHEVELGVVISKRATEVTAQDAMNFVAGYALVLDMTARDFLEQAQRDGTPWIFVKGCDTFTPVSKFIAMKQIPDPNNLNLWCKVNGQMRQNGNTKDMIFKIPFLISFITTSITLEANDLVLMGTPKGGARVRPGDKIECGIDELIKMSYEVISK
uniref:Oxaloacetate tautomerase FAHD1, mitochondrial n=1 Tax=Strigamia maritima TaxID=126957 RepID=T1ISN6_STRMM